MRHPEHPRLYHSPGEPCPDPDRCAALLAARTARAAIIERKRHPAGSSGLDSRAGIFRAFRAERPAPLPPLPEDWDAPVAAARPCPTHGPDPVPFDSHADRDRVRAGLRMAGTYVNHTGTVHRTGTGRRRARVFVASPDGTVTVRRMIAHPFRPARRQSATPGPSPVFGPSVADRWPVRTVDAWTLALILDRDIPPSIVDRIADRDAERAALGNLMSGGITEGSAGLPWDSVYRRAPSVAQAHERAQINYAESITADGPDGIPLGTFVRVDGADGTARTFDVRTRVRADAIRAARTRWDRDRARPVRCDGPDATDGRAPREATCGTCKPCKARDRDRKRNARKRAEATERHAVHVDTVSAWSRAHGERVAARHGL